MVDSQWKLRGEGGRHKAPVAVRGVGLEAEPADAPRRFSGAQHAARRGQSQGSGMKPDSGFVQEAASGGLMEVQLGQIAQQKAASSAVKQFASQTLPTLQEHLRLAKRVA